MRVLPQRNHDRRLRVERTDEERRRLPCAERQYPRPSDPREFTKCGQSAPGGGGAAFRGDPWHPPGDPSRYEHEAGRNEHSRRAGRGPPATRYRSQPQIFPPSRSCLADKRLADAHQTVRSSRRRLESPRSRMRTRGQLYEELPAIFRWLFSIPSFRSPALADEIRYPYLPPQEFATKTRLQFAFSRSGGATPQAP